MFEDLKVPVGRPMEFNVPQQDMQGYLLGAKFKKQLTKFFKFWDKAVITKSHGDQFYVSNMENFFGEILDKFEEIPNQQELLSTEYPFKMLSELTNLKLPTVFPDKQDNKDFIEIFLTHKFE